MNDAVLFFEGLKSAKAFLERLNFVRKHPSDTFMLYESRFCGSIWTEKSRQF